MALVSSIKHNTLIDTYWTFIPDNKDSISFWAFTENKDASIEADMLKILQYDVTFISWSVNNLY